MHRVKFSALSILPLLAFMCLSDTAAGQSISLQDCSGNAAASPLPFFVPANTPHTSTAAQESFCAVSSNGATTSMQASTTVNGQATPWLYLNGANGTISNLSVPPAGWALTVAVDTSNSGLISGNTYFGSFQVCYSAGNNCDTIQVKLTVTAGNSGGGTLTTSPSSLSFSAVAGSSTASPSSTSFEIFNASGTSGNCTMSAATTTGGNWLLVNGSINGAACLENSNTNEVPVTLDPNVLSTLAVGTYNGTITITDGSGNQATVPVTLTVSGSTGLIATPAAFTFLYQIGQTTPAAQTLVVTTNSATSISFTLSSTASWLSWNPISANAVSGAPVDIALNVNTTQLSKGTYTTNLLLNSLTGSPLATIPVTLVISNNPLLLLSTSSLTFNAAFAGQSPVSQSVQVSTTGSGGSVGFTANPSSGSASWLTVNTTSNATPATLSVSVNSGSLPVGTTNGAIIVSPTNGDNYTETINVSVTVSNAAQITVGPSTLFFSYETNKTGPGSQAVLVQSTGQSTTFTTSVNTTSCGNGWLSVSNSGGFTTPATIPVSVTLPSTTAAGVCTGTVGITPAGTSTPVNVSVTVGVSATTPLLTIQQNPGFGVFTVQQGGAAPNTQNLFLGSTDNTALLFGVQFTSDRGWLYTNQTSGSTPTSLSVNVNPGGLAAGTYGGTLTVTSSNLPAGLSGQFAIRITLVVTPNVTVTESPSTMSFSFTANQSAAVQSQNITLSSSGGTASYSATLNTLSTCPTGLLSLSPTSGTANGTIQVSIGSTNFTAGTYTCQIALAYLNSTNTSSTVTVTVTIAPAITVTESPATLTYAYTIGGTQPASQAITISSIGGPAQFTVGTTVTGGGNWLSVDTTSGATAGSGSTQTKAVNVSVNTAGLAGSATGTAYTGSVTISSTLLATPITVAVTLTVTQPPNPGITVVTNNASNLAGVISPGELITIKGTLLGPATPANFSVNSSGGVSNTLSGVQVTFDGIPGTPIYVSAVQINVTAPWEIAGRLTTNIVVTYNGNASTALPVRVSDYAPALYTLNSTGSGQAAAVNQNGTFNGPPGGSTVPAPGGTVVVLYGTGCGQTSPPGTTGSVAPTTQLLEVTAPVAVGFGPLSNPLYGKVLFIGAAPGLVTGVCQINVQLPAGLGSGSQFVTMTVGGVSSPQGPTIAIQ